MSVVKSATFTLRDLNRQIAKVLETCDKLGSVRIRSRRGKTYELTLESRPSKIEVLPDFAARSKRMAELAARKRVFSKRGWDRLARLIASE